MAEGTEEIARGYFEAVSNRDPDAMVSFWEPGTIDRLVGIADLRAPEGIRDWFGEMFAAFPDFDFQVTEMVTEGNKAAVRWRADATFDGTGSFAGLHPNGAKIVLEGIDLVTVADGKITGNQAYLNGADLARQLGALPPEGSLPDRAMLGALNLVTKAKRAIAERRG